MVVSKEELGDQFQIIGLTVPEDILNLCLELCERRNLSESELVDSWVAYSMTVLEACNAPTAETLIAYEKKQFNEPTYSTPKRAKSSHTLAKKERSQSISSPSTSRTPSAPPKEVSVGEVASGLHVGPEAGSAVPDVCPDLPERSLNDIKSGETLLSYGFTSDNQFSSSSPTSVQLYGREIKKTWTCMLDILSEEWNIKEDFVEELVNQMIWLHELPNPSPIDDLRVENTFYVGKVFHEAGRIESPIIKVEGIGPFAREEIELDLSSISEFSVFPGQVIGFKGVSQTTKKVFVSELFTSARPPKPETPTFTEHFSFLVAAGPFTPPNSFDVSHIHPLIERIKALQPGLVFLVGPLMDLTHVDADSGSNNSSFNKNFDKLHNDIITEISLALDGSKTKLYYIASHKDGNAIPVFPTPQQLSQKWVGCQTFPDPSLLNIDGLLVGFTTTDIISFLSHHEFSNSRGGNRVARLAGHLIKQQSFFPLQSGSSVMTPIDLSKLYTSARIPVIPHILVLPSVLGQFIKEVEDCVVINPERCLKGNRPNNLAFVEVKPAGADGSWSPATHISAKVMRI